MAPEQAAGDDVTTSWDVWALTVIAFEMLTGRHPFRRAVIVGTAAGAGMVGAELCGGRSPIPDALRSFFQRALSPAASQRPHDADAFLVEIEQVLA
jgi:serine/threonine-protein kinase